MMPSYIVRQPNGLLAVFSTIVDAFTIFDMTEEEAVEEMREKMGREDALAKVKRGVEDQPLTGGPPGSGLDRWNSCLKTMAPDELRRQRTEYAWVWAGKVRAE
jgi:hypothetical protein